MSTPKSQQPQTEHTYDPTHPTPTPEHTYDTRTHAQHTKTTLRDFRARPGVRGEVVVGPIGSYSFGFI